jgi:hypothetical protein
VCGIFLVTTDVHRIQQKRSVCLAGLQECGRLCSTHSQLHVRLAHAPLHASEARAQMLSVLWGDCGDRRGSFVLLCVD